MLGIEIIRSMCVLGKDGDLGYSRLPQGMARGGSLSHNLVSRCVKCYDFNFIFVLNLVFLGSLPAC